MTTLIDDLTPDDNTNPDNLMNPGDANAYDPAEDGNQGISTKLAQGEEANPGVSQIDYMNPTVNQGPEPIKEEVDEHNDRPADAVLSSSTNDDLLAEEAVEKREPGMDDQE